MNGMWLDSLRWIFDPEGIVCRTIIISVDEIIFMLAVSNPSSRGSIPW